MEDNDIPKGVKEFFDISSSFERDDSPEGEYEATRLSQARTSLFLDMPFFGWILGHLEIYPTNDPRINSYGADTRRLYINSKFTQDKKKERLKGLLMHLVTHLIMKHGERQTNRDKNIWSVSSDVTANFIVEQARSLLLSNTSHLNPNKRAEFDKTWEIEDTSSIPTNLKDTSADKVYHDLHNYAKSLRGIERSDSQKSKKKSRRQDEFSEEIYEEVRDYSGIENPCGFSMAMEEMQAALSESMSKLESDRFSGIIRSGWEQGRNRGNIPSSIKEQIQDLLEPKIPWYVLLEQYIQKTIMSDWRWNPPNRRMVGMDIHLPSTTKEYLNVIVAVDTSGSISTQELTSFVSEAHAILTSFASVKMTLIDCDARVQQVLEIEEGQSVDGSPLPWEGRPFKGRGGTSFIPVFEWVSDKKMDPDLLIYFTDGYGSYPSVVPPYPIVWVMTTEYEVPFGETIRYNRDDL